MIILNLAHSHLLKNRSKSLRAFNEKKNVERKKKSSKYFFTSSLVIANAKELNIEKKKIIKVNFTLIELQTLY